MAHPIVMPSLGMFTAEGTLTAWLRPHGAKVEASEPIAEITTEKTTQEVVAPAAGIVHQVAGIGSNLPVQGLIGYILAEGEALPASAAPAPGVASPASATGAPAAMETPRVGAPRPTAGGEVRASPIARRIAAEHGIDVASLVGTGPGGRIVEADVQAEITRRAAIGASASPAAPTESARRIREKLPLIGMRRTIAERLRSSLSTAAPVTLTREVDADVLVAARERLSQRLGESIPFDALFIKVLAAALRERPRLNAVIEGDAILVLDEINVGFAVAVADGLIVPVVRDAATRSLGDVSATVRALSERARNNQLQLSDLAGGTATITNLGAYGVDAFTPIINPPQSVILGIGRILTRPVIRDGQLAVGQTCVLSLTFDHRVVDGVPAAQLLDTITRLVGDEQFLGALA